MWAEVEEGGTSAGNSAQENPPPPEPSTTAVSDVGFISTACVVVPCPCKCFWLFFVCCVVLLQELNALSQSSTHPGTFRDFKNIFSPFFVIPLPSAKSHTLL